MKNTTIYTGMGTYYMGKIAHVLECINKDDKKDIEIQGRRWYIRSARCLWSVTESELLKYRYCK